MRIYTDILVAHTCTTHLIQRLHLFIYISVSRLGIWWGEEGGYEIGIKILGGGKKYFGKVNYDFGDIK